jgi:hypothetical protein
MHIPGKTKGGINERTAKSPDRVAWLIDLALLTGRTNGDKKLVRSAYKAADAFETVHAGHEESLKGRQRRA